MHDVKGAQSYLSRLLATAKQPRAGMSKVVGLPESVRLLIREARKRFDRLLVTNAFTLLCVLDILTFSLECMRR